MKISIIGSGYVGLVTAAGFAHFGHEIVCIDIDKDKINKLNTGQCPVFEPGLETVLQQNSPRLRFSTAFEDVANSDAVFLCVGTPPSPTGHADLSALGSACLAIKDHIKNTNAVIVTKSTVPVGTGDKVADWLDHRFEVISNPEFLKEGDAVRDCLRPDRIIIGVEGKSPHYNVLMSELYRPFVRTPDQILFVKRESAELIKYANNAMLATRISFMNELARLCEVVGADVDDIRRGIGSDERIGSAFLYAGCSFGGSCFSKDLQSLVAQGEDVGEIMSVAGSALGTNNFHREWFFNKLVEPFAGGGGTVALWGLAFKPGTDDVRDSPAIDFATWLAKKNFSVRVYDPQARGTAQVALDGLDNIVYCAGPYEAAGGADALVLCTEWPQLRYPDWQLLSQQMNDPATILDGRNIWSRDEVEHHGFSYDAVGRPE